ncbi:MAG: KTSC domain-containing protein [Acidobacteriia bacterium]|nr:KTSC domain-containing protein [Terriglobia bacterium]
MMGKLHDVLAKDKGSVPVPQSSSAASQAKWVSVDSANLKEILYGPEDRILIVRFRRDGAAHCYGDVNPALYAGLLKADSANTYFCRYIKGRHKEAKLDL